MQVILVTIDCGRYDILLNQAFAPNVVTQIAPRSRIYHRHFANANITLPSISSILTSNYPRFTGIYSNMPEGRRLPTTFLEPLSGVRKHFLSNASFMRTFSYKGLLDSWFDTYDIGTPSPDGAIQMTDKVVEYLSAPGDFFLWVHFFNAHEPYGYIPDPTKDSAFSEDVRFMRIRPNRELFVGASFEDLLGLYRGQIQFLDSQVGRIFHARPPGSVFFLTADHGEALGENEIFFSHAGLFPPTVHIPLLICLPDADQVEQIGRLTANIDLGPTIMTLFGVEVPESFRGVDVLGEIPQGREIYIQSAGDTANAVVTGGHLYIEAIEPYDPEHANRCHKTHLVDLSTEKDLMASGIPLSGEQDRLRHHMAALLKKWRGAGEAPRATPPVQRDEELQEKLRDLGYI